MTAAPDGVVPPLYTTESYSHIPAPPLSRLSPTDAIKRALHQFSQLTGKHPESLTGMKPTTDGGWSILVDILELERIPDSTSVMAIYRIDLDPAGEMLTCERLRKYHRGDTDGA
jgi:Gas vesicle synthesis protein GvpO